MKYMNLKTGQCIEAENVRHAMKLLHMPLGSGRPYIMAVTDKEKRVQMEGGI
jgi:hypothetical protein